MTKLLIVDDNEQNLYMLQVLLEGNGYEVVTAANGTEALEKARRDPPDMIITDILMPVMDGFALCRQWKRDEHLKEIPIVFYTATYTDPKDEELALNLGAERFIIKPVEPDVFVGMLRDVIEEHKAGRLAAPREPVEEEEPYLREYNEALIRKMEDKMLELEQANQTLERHAQELEQRVAERKQAEEQVKKSLQEKEILLRELYHRTKNNMQVICSMLALQSQYTKDEQVLKIFEETENRIKSMALVHQKLYQSKNLSSIDLKDYISDFTDFLVKDHRVESNRISFIFDMDSVLVLIDTAIPCGLVLNELISNSLKHAFPGDMEGEIRIRLKKTEEGEIELRVSDNGVGVTKDFDFRQSDTLGVQTLIKHLSEKIVKF